MSVGKWNKHSRHDGANHEYSPGLGWGSARKLGWLDRPKVSQMNMRRGLIREMREEIAAVGGTVQQTIKGRKHWKVFWVSVTGERHITVCAATTSDFRAALNVRANIRRKARFQGQ